MFQYFRVGVLGSADAGASAIGLESCQIDEGVIWAGMVIGLMEDIPTCADLLSAMVAECRQRLSQALAWKDD